MAGKPVIGAGIPSSMEIIDDGLDGFLVELDNSVELAGKIILLLSDSSLRDSMGRRGMEKVLKNYTWEIVANRIEKVYESIINWPY